ncbi:SH3 domain-containing protein [Ruminococcus sp. OA3]|uniref:SH3 domain-containing protein n=1 Tax=Ruminococcus sp. OA3 TaxID=2914164 RepID=UPI001F053623|nr:SH3 domain-containing protein [Ruminococcus sp. OA3]MCH1983996.1 SH3 domain-containing protein [Ruminococcus sp. OA3]
MGRKIVSTALVFVLCTGIFTGCNPFPLREEAKVTQPKTPGQLEDEAENAQNEGYDSDVIAPDETPDGTVMYCSSAVNVRTMPSTQGTVIGELTAGEKVTVTGKEDGWYEIVFDGKTAYVYKDYLTDTIQDEE